MKSFTVKGRNKHRGGMALVTLQRSPSVAGSPPQCGSEEEAEDDEGSKTEKSECFFAGKSTALVLTPKDIQMHHAERRLSTDSTKSTNSTQSNNSDIQQHLQSMIDLLRSEETLKMAVKLESQRDNRTRYLVIASRCCYRTSTTDRKSKITRNNSAKTQSSTAAAAVTAVATATSATSTSATRQLSVDGTSSYGVGNGNGNGNNNSNSNRTQQQSQMTSQPECVEMREKRLSASSMSASSNRQSVKCDADKHSASGDIKPLGDGVEESCLLGIDCNDRTTIGLVVPILADTTIHLDGDGGFSVSVYGRTHIFKPVSVQAMWSALQTLHKVSQKARENNFYPGGPSHDWLSFYENRIESDQSCLNEWNAMDSLESRRPPSPDAIRNKPTAKEETESVIKMKLKEIMMSVDLDEVTSKYIRGRLEELLDMDLGEYKSFIDEEMLIILGQMDAPTEIFEHVYLGSEWNASNLEELQKNGVRHILNVTREIDNFFPGMFDYFNVRVYDDEKTNLLKHWDNTYRYITRAKSEGSKVLVHCKMGVSRSASVVIAYAMKAYNWEFKHALQHVKDRRNCIKPNKNFLNQLETYRGMLDAMKNKEKLQRSKSETNLKSTKDARLLPGSEPTPLIQALNQSKSKSAGNGVSGDGVRGTVEVSGGIVSVSSISSASDQKQRRIVRRSSSTSPKSIQGHTAIVMKQQSHSLENLTPERSVADEPKNMRFPGSNGENYSVTQNQVRHIQKNTPPPPPPPPPSASAMLATVQVVATLAPQPPTSVRTIVHDLESYKDTRKTADDRKSLNLPFGRSMSHDTSTRAGVVTDVLGDDVAAASGGSVKSSGLGSPVWTSSAKLITQTSNLMMQRNVGEALDTMVAAAAAVAVVAPLCSPQRMRRNTAGSGCSNFDSGDMFSSQVDSVFAREEEEKRHSRKARSWAATSSEGGGGIIMDTQPNSKLGSNSSIDSASSSTTSAVYEGCVRTRPRQRELPSRHASWGSGDNRCSVPMRNSSWGSYDTNRNTFQYGVGIVAGAIFEGQIHELNKSNKTAIATPPHPHNQRAVTVGGSAPHHYHHVGTVKRTKLKLEECGTAATLEKLCQENGEDIASDTGTGKTSLLPTANSPQKSKSSSLFRSASVAGSTRAQYPYRCNSEEIMPSGVSGMMPRVMRRSDGSRPLQGELFSASAPESYTMSDIENKNTMPAQGAAGDESTAEETVIMRHAPQACTTAMSAEEQRISGTVQILKKSFEAKAGVAGGSGAGSALQLQVNTAKKGHQSLPSSPVAQHMDHSANATAADASVTNLPPCTTASAPSTFDQSAAAAVATAVTTSSSNPTSTSNSTSNFSSSSSSSSSVFEPCDRNVKDLVHKYQTTTTTAATSTSTSASATPAAVTATAAASSAAVAISASNFKPRPRSCYDNAHTQRSSMGKPHEFSDSRPPPAPVKTTLPTAAATSAAPVQAHGNTTNSTTSTPMTESILMQQPQLQPQRRLQQHGKTHPLTRLSLSKQSFNAAAYNTM